MITMNRRSLLRNIAAASAGLAIAPGVLDWRAAASSAATTLPASYPLLPFADHYQTNVSANITFASNAAVEILSQFSQVWQTGAEWDNGVVLDPKTLHPNMLHSVRVTHDRTEAQAKQAYIVDRQNHTYYMGAGLGPLASCYYAGTESTTTITSAPDGVQNPIASDNGNDEGVTTSALGDVVTLSDAIRGNYSSGNPAKYSFMYPRPWRMTNDSVVADTGKVDEYGYPIYESDVIVEPQLLLARSLTPDTDDAFPSGHMNAFMLAALGLGYAIPERFQELITRAMEGGDYRIVAGMHSLVDVIGARILGTALAAAILNDPANATIKAAARANALAYFEAKTGTTDLWAFAHSENLTADPYADRAHNERMLAPLWTYVLPRHGPAHAPMVVPDGAEVLLETRQPYLSADQRREVLRTTALPSGHVMLDGPEAWGRLNLFAAADGYGCFDTDMTVVMDASLGGFDAADAWKNDIGGVGGLIKQGSGSLTLSGDNSFSGGVTITGGTVAAASSRALGRGPVTVEAAGTLAVISPADVRAEDSVSVTGTLAATPGVILEAGGDVSLDRSSELTITLPRGFSGHANVPVISARRVRGQFGTVSVTTPGYQATAGYSRGGVSAAISRA